MNEALYERDKRQMVVGGAAREREMASGSSKEAASFDDSCSPTEYDMIRLLREDRVATEFGKLRRKSKTMSVAAPFWGLGAATTLGFKAGDEVRVLCRFDAPACNPSALLEVAELGASVRSHRRLHAKLYVADGIVVVGSSNPSRFGLTQEGDVVGGTVEANIMTDDPEAVKSVTDLFEDLWNDDDETVPVTMAMIRKEIKRRELNPPPQVRRQLIAKSLLSACREAPELFSSVVVCPYDTNLGEEGRKVLRQLHLQASDERAELGVASFRRSWAYQFESPPPDGSWIIDLDCKGDQPIIHGASKVPTPAYRLKADGENDVTVTVRGVVSVPGARGEFKISKQDRADLASVAKAILKSDGEFIPLPEVVAIIDRRATRAGAAAAAKPKRGQK